MGIQDTVFDLEAFFDELRETSENPEGVDDAHGLFGEVVEALWKFEDRADKAETKLAAIAAGGRAFLDAIDGID